MANSEDYIQEVNGNARLTKNEIVLEDENEAMVVANILKNNNYCVMLSKEEQFTVVNFVECYDVELFGKSARSYVYFNHEYELEDIDDIDDGGTEKEGDPFEEDIE